MKTITKITYSNGVTDIITCESKKSSKPTQKESSPEKKTLKNKKKDFRKKRQRLRVIINSTSEPFNYAFTLTSGIESERNDPKKLREITKKYLDKLNITYVFCIEQSHVQNDNPCETEACSECGYHIHGLSNVPFDFDNWRDKHKCTNKALYMDEIRDLNKYTSYISKSCDKIHGIHFYCSSFRPKPFKKEKIFITDNNIQNAPLVKREGYEVITDFYEPLSIVKRFLNGTKKPSNKELQIVFMDYLALKGGEVA